METRWVDLDECVDAVLARRVQNPSLADRRARGARVARTGLEHPRRGRRRVARALDAAREPPDDDGCRVDRRSTSGTSRRARPLTQHGDLVPARPRHLRGLAGERAASTDRAPCASRTSRDFVRYLGADRQPPLATSSIARVLSAVRGLHRFLAEEGVIAADVSRELRPPKLPMRLPKAIPVEDVEALIAAVGGEEPHELRDTALLELLYATGARVSEAIVAQRRRPRRRRGGAAARQGRQAAHRAARVVCPRGRSTRTWSARGRRCPRAARRRRRCSSGCAGGGCRDRRRGT